MNPDTPVVLDACVLVPRLLCDLLLRLAETPRLYAPRWSDIVLDEVGRNQVRLGLPLVRAESWRAAVGISFPEALVEEYEPLLPECRNDPKDRHVLAAAIKTGAAGIVTFNVRDFPPAALEPWGVLAIRPSVFLLGLYETDPDVVLVKLTSMTRVDRTLVNVLDRLRLVVPTFVDRVTRDLR